MNELFKRSIVTIFLSEKDREELGSSSPYIDVTVITRDGYKSKLLAYVEGHGYKLITPARFKAGVTRFNNSLEKI